MAEDGKSKLGKLWQSKTPVILQQVRSSLDIPRREKRKDHRIEYSCNKLASLEAMLVWKYDPWIFSFFSFVVEKEQIVEQKCQKAENFKRNCLGKLAQKACIWMSENEKVIAG